MFVIVYLLFSAYREEDFQQRQKEEIITTLGFISEIEKDKKELAEALDRLTINSLLNEKLLIFDSQKKLIYSNLDDVPVVYSDRLLLKLNEKNAWIETKDGLSDVVGIYFRDKEKGYYGISKAFDEFGYTKLSFLRNLLVAVFLLFTTLVILIAIYISKRLTQPITVLAGLLENYRIGETPDNNYVYSNTLEIDYLNNKFQELVNRANHAYIFQKNSIHHISHQLKTPIAVLISEMERIQAKSHDKNLQTDISRQISKTRSLAEIINTLLEISKIESGQKGDQQVIRIDELLFDCISELNLLNPDFLFEVQYHQTEPDSVALSISGNELLLRQAFLNLLNNCISYSDNGKAEISINTKKPEALQVFFTNSGKTITKEEESFLFSHFFRGENSRNKMGFGLGLTLSKSIFEMHLKKWV